MQIGEVAKEAGIKAQTIRFYERRGLLKTPARTASGYRTYPPSVVQIVRFIKQSQELGYTLAEIKLLLALHGRSGNAAQVRALATAKIDSINQRIESLVQMRDELENIVAHCQCGDKAQPDCPAIEKLDHRATNS
ncbi:MAG: heavy metal-responsive transcriptional regulator [Acidobacteriota bacterium]|nr:heavy metal-responsive transcriptional regulator [Acidobacteriota bacterium]